MTKTQKFSAKIIYTTDYRPRAVYPNGKSLFLGRQWKPGDRVEITVRLRKAGKR